VIVALDLPAGGELTLFGQVVWTRRRLESRNRGALETPGYGIEFLGVSRAEQAAVQQILDADEAARRAMPASPSGGVQPLASSGASTIPTSIPSAIAPPTTTNAPAAAAPGPIRAAFPPVR
jgi:hypothetical protein